jgi:hypothetical protein
MYQYNFRGRSEKRIILEIHNQSSYAVNIFSWKEVIRV